MGDKRMRIVVGKGETVNQRQAGSWYNLYEERCALLEQDKE